jgi:hypothetical protein
MVPFGGMVDPIVGSHLWIPSMDPFGGYDCRIPLLDRVDKSLRWTFVANPW